MNAARRKRLEAAGWKVGTVQEFLGLSDEEVRLIDLHIALTQKIRHERARLGMSQHQLAKRLGSSQSRVAKLENGADGSSLDLIFRALYCLGLSDAAIAREIARKRPAA